MHDVRTLAPGGHRQVGARECAAPALASASAGRHAVRRDARLVPRGAHAVDPDVDQAAQLPGEVLDVHAGTAVDLGRVLTGQQVDAHRGHDRASDKPSARSPGAR